MKIETTAVVDPHSNCKQKMGKYYLMRIFGTQFSANTGFPVCCSRIKMAFE